MTSERPSTPGAFTSGFCFAIVACAGILALRVTHGTLAVAAVAHLVFTGAVVVVAALRGMDRPRLGAQAIGAALGIVVAHALLRSSGLPTSATLVEVPAQLVNDAIAVFAPLAIVHASTRRPPSTAMLVATLSLVTLYRLTASAWHFDPGRFDHSVQDIVTLELACSALGVMAFRFIVPVRC